MSIWVGRFCHGPANVNMLPFVKVIKVKSLQLRAGEHGRTTLDTIRLDDALIQVDSIWGTADNTFTTDPHPLHETGEECFCRHQLKGLLQKYAPETTNTCWVTQ